MSELTKVYNIGEWVNSETGELRQGIITDVSTLEKDLQQKKQYANKKDTNYLTRSDTPFIFYFMETVKELTETLQKDPRNRGTYLGYLLILNTYLNREGYLIQYENAGKPLNRSGIKKVLNIGSHHTSKLFIDCMLEQGVLLEVDTDKGKGFAMNSEHSLNGSVKDKSKILRVYSKTLREMYVKNTAEDFTFIYSLIPYVDFHFNTICFNPYEKEPSEINTMSIQDIADITDVTVQTVYTKIRDLTFNNMPIFHRHKGGNKQYIVINPEVLARNAFERESTVRGYFQIKGKE